MTTDSFNEHLLDDVNLEGVSGKPQSFQDVLEDAAEDTRLDFKPEHLRDVNMALVIANSKIPFTPFTPEYMTMAIAKAFRVGRAYQALLSKRRLI